MSSSAYRKFVRRKFSLYAVTKFVRKMSWLEDLGASQDGDPQMFHQ